MTMRTQYTSITKREHHFLSNFLLLFLLFLLLMIANWHMSLITSSFITHDMFHACDIVSINILCNSILLLFLFRENINNEGDAWSDNLWASHERYKQSRNRHIYDYHVTNNTDRFYFFWNLFNPFFSVCHKDA